MSLTKSAMDPAVRPLSSEEENARASEADCREALDAIVGTFKALDLLHLRAARAAGYGTPMWRRIDAAWSKIEAGLDMLRAPSTEARTIFSSIIPGICRWDDCLAVATTKRGNTDLCTAHAADADEIDREASIKPEMEAEDAF